jgi:FixJ family two-component response regulator
MGSRILIIEDNELLADTFQRFLTGAGYEVDVAGDYAGGKELLTSDSYGAVFMDINLRGSQTGIDLLREIRNINIDTPVVIVTGFPEVATAAEAVRHTAFDYLCKPLEKEQLLRVAAAAVTYKTTADEKKRYQKNLEDTFRRVRDAMVMVDLDNKSISMTDAPRIPENRTIGEARVTREILLSERERQILELLGRGEQKEMIATVFEISVRTVETYLGRIVSKLQLDGIKELRRYAMKNN